MFDTSNRFNCFIIRSFWAVPLYFYVFIPLILRKTALPIALILSIAIVSLLWCWRVKRRAYKGKPNGVKRYIGDISAMTLGLVLLYSVEICVYLDTNTINLVLYFLAFLTYIPALLSTQSVDTK